MGRTIAGARVEKKEEVERAGKFTEGNCHTTKEEIASVRAGE
jgi:hypothetical protein